VKRFTRPDSGLVDAVVSSTSGLLPGPGTRKTRKEIFLAGTQPTTFDTMDQEESDKTTSVLDQLRQSLLGTDLGGDSVQLPPLDTSGSGTDSTTNHLLQ